MKKIFFYAGLLALATSCTDEFDSLNVQNENAKGITFEAVEGVDSRMQWNDEGATYSPFWYAEKDRIGIFAAGVDSKSGDSWDELATTAKTYKPTQSKKNGVFTSTDDANTLNFDGDNVARFLAVYPNTVTADATTIDGKIELSSLPNLASQTQNTLKGDNEAMLMYDLTTASRENDYDAVGEKVQLSFQKPLSAIVFKTANANAYTAEDESGNSVFGKLKSIKYTNKGSDKDGNGVYGESGDLAASLITFNSDASFVVDTISVDGKEAAKFEKGTTGAAAEITLNLGVSGLTWNDDALAMMVVNNVDRKKFRQADLAEGIEVLYSFEKIEIQSKTDEVSVDFDGFLEFPALDINEFDYLVTLGSATDNGSNDRTLIVNKGNFSDIFDEELNNVVWNDANLKDPSKKIIDPDNFTEIIIGENVELSEEEFALLEEFANVEKLTLGANTELKEGYLDGLENLRQINMPKVTSIEAGSFYLDVNEKPIFTHVALPAYDFEDLAINPEILNKETLIELDMSGVSIMNAGFPARGLTLEGYEKLEKVTVTDGIQIGSNAFNGCYNLTEVNGKVNIIGTAAFKNAGITTQGDAAKYLETVILTDESTEIPANTFENCDKLANILVNGEQIAPTKVDAQAFKGCVALKTMDLSNLTAIGQEAFMNCATLIGVEKAMNGKNVLKVGAAYISNSAFNNCDALTYVYFMNATSFGTTILNDCALLAEIKFGEAFEYPENRTAADVTGLFGSNTSSMKLFVNPNQDVRSLNDNKLILTKKNFGDWVGEIPFASITKEVKF